MLHSQKKKRKRNGNFHEDLSLTQTHSWKITKEPSWLVVSSSFPYLAPFPHLQFPHCWLSRALDIPVTYVALGLRKFSPGQLCWGYIFPDSCLYSQPSSPEVTCPAIHFLRGWLDLRMGLLHVCMSVHIHELKRWENGKSSPPTLWRKYACL